MKNALFSNIKFRENAIKFMKKDLKDSIVKFY